MIYSTQTHGIYLPFLFSVAPSKVSSENAITTYTHKMMFTATTATTALNVNKYGESPPNALLAKPPFQNAKNKLNGINIIHRVAYNNFLMMGLFSGTCAILLKPEACLISYK